MPSIKQLDETNKKMASKFKYHHTIFHTYIHYISCIRVRIHAVWVRTQLRSKSKYVYIFILRFSESASNYDGSIAVDVVLYLHMMSMLITRVIFGFAKLYIWFIGPLIDQSALIAFFFRVAKCTMPHRGYMVQATNFVNFDYGAFRRLVSL